MDVHIDKSGHKELAIKAIHDATVAGNNVTEILEQNVDDENHSKWSLIRVGRAAIFRAYSTDGDTILNLAKQEMALICSVLSQS